MLIYENYFYYDDSLWNVLLSDLIAEFAAQDSFPIFRQSPDHAIHKSLLFKEPLEVHIFKFEEESEAWVVRIYNDKQALIGQVRNAYKYYDNVGTFVDEHRKRIAGEEGEGTFNAFAKKYGFYIGQ